MAHPDEDKMDGYEVLADEFNKLLDVAGEKMTTDVMGAITAILDGRTGVPALRIKKLIREAVIPTRGSEQAIGLDLVVPFNAQAFFMTPGSRAVVDLGIAIAIPSGCYGRIAPRSGLAAKNGVDVLGGVIDADYRGEIKVILLNHGNEVLVVKPGMKIAQLILERAVLATTIDVDDLDETDRGEAGFGSTDLMIETA